MDSNVVQMSSLDISKKLKSHNNSYNIKENRRQTPTTLLQLYYQQNIVQFQKYIYTPSVDINAWLAIVTNANHNNNNNIPTTRDALPGTNVWNLVHSVSLTLIDIL